MRKRLEIVVVLACLAVMLMTSLRVEAQLKKFPVPRRGSSTTKNTSTSGRIKTVTPIALPFWDDFSFTDGDTPKEELWVNSNTVWVNSGMAINAPTIYTATFDGLDSLGLPFTAEVLSNGYRDKLVSAPILLNLPAANRTQLYLSFYYQWQGNGEAPDQEDYLIVEFKNSSGVWKERYII